MALFVLFAATVSANAELRIEKAYCGAKGSWRDVTAFLQGKVEGDKLSMTIWQPFREIGGDPAPDRGKNLVIDYRLNGVPFELALNEQYPTAFTVELPSSAAVAPGHDPLAAALIKDARSHQGGGHSWLNYFSYGTTLISIVWAVVLHPPLFLASPGFALLFKWTCLLALGWAIHLVLRHRHARWRLILWRGILCIGVALPLLHFFPVPASRSQSTLTLLTWPDSPARLRRIPSPVPPGQPCHPRRIQRLHRLRRLRSPATPTLCHRLRPGPSRGEAF